MLGYEASRDLEEVSVQGVRAEITYPAHWAVPGPLSDDETTGIAD